MWRSRIPFVEPGPLKGGRGSCTDQLRTDSVGMKTSDASSATVGNAVRCKLTRA